MTSLNTGIKL